LEATSGYGSGKIKEENIPSALHDPAAARRCLQDSLRRLVAAGGGFAAAPPAAEKVEQ
jgi:hypothetical protein